MDHNRFEASSGTQFEGWKLSGATASGAFHRESYSHPTVNVAAPEAPAPGGVTGVARAVAKGVGGGIGEVVTKAGIDPVKTVAAVGTGIAESSLLALGVRAVATREALPLIAGAAFALDIIPSLKPMKAGLVGAWNGSISEANASKALRPLGHFALTYGVAKGTSELLAAKVFKPSLKVELEPERPSTISNLATERIKPRSYGASTYARTEGMSLEEVQKLAQVWRNIDKEANAAGKFWFKPIGWPETK